MGEGDKIISADKRNSDVPVLYSLRAIAALSVCFFHYVCTTTGFFHNKFLLTVFSPGKYGVQMFFVISGFVIPWSMYNGGYTFKKFFTFLSKRLLRLEPPYVVSVITAVVLLVLRQKYLEHLPNSHIDVTQVMLHFGYMIPFFKNYTWLNQVYWTLAIEFQFYFFMAFIFVPLLKGKLLARLILYTAVLCITLFYLFDDFLPYYLPFFMLGIILFLKKKGQMTTAEFYIGSALMIFACVYRFSYLPTLYALFAYIGIAYFERKDNKITHFIGEISYSIYLFHPLIGATLVNVLSHYTHSPALKILLVLAGVAVTLIGSYIIYIVVERPSKRLSGKLKYRLT